MPLDRNLKVCVFEAGNTEAPALAVLKKLGFKVTRIKAYSEQEPYFQAENAFCIVRSDSLHALLGLAILATERGKNWFPTDQEVETFLELCEVGS